MFREWLENTPENIERVEQFRTNIYNFKLNTYDRTRYNPREHPQDLMVKWLQRIRKIREWLGRLEFPVTPQNLDLAAQELSDALLDFRRTGGILEPAHYQGGADPKNAETLSQFALFIQKRVDQPKVYGKQLTAFGQAWDAFIEDFEKAFREWKRS